MADISEDRVDLLEEKMRAKIDTMTGFSDVEGKSRALHKVREMAVANVECLMNSTRTLSYHVPCRRVTIMSCCKRQDRLINPGIHCPLSFHGFVGYPIVLSVVVFSVENLTDQSEKCVVCAY